MFREKISLKLPPCTTVSKRVRKLGSKGRFYPETSALFSKKLSKREFYDKQARNSVFQILPNTEFCACKNRDHPAILSKKPAIQRMERNVMHSPFTPTQTVIFAASPVDHWAILTTLIFNKCSDF